MRPARERGGVLGVALLVVLAVVALSGVAVFQIIESFAREFRVDHQKNRNGEAVRVSTPVGSVRIQSHRSLDMRQLGIPVYPGAVLEKGNKGASFEVEHDGRSEELIVTASVYSTDDSVTAVRDFYRKEMPHWILTKDGIEYTEHGYRRIITITRKHGRTWIAVASIGEPASN